MAKRATPPITLPDYERLFRTIHAVSATGQSDPANSSLFFSVAGAYLIKRHHKLNSASPVAGVAGYNVSESGSSFIVFGKTASGAYLADKGHFHCWVEVDGWVVDLMAPLFREMISADRKVESIPRFMFEKPVVADASAIGLDRPGAYFHVPNDRLTTDLMKDFAENPIHSDLVRICDQWYARQPRKIAQRAEITDQAGNTKEVSLSPIRIEGTW